MRRARATRAARLPRIPTQEQLAALKTALEPARRAQGAMYRRAPTERLRWVLRFAAGQLRPDEAEGQAHALALLSPEGWQTDMDALEPLRPVHLRRLRREIRQGLARLLAGDSWALPLPRAAWFNRASLVPSGYQLRWQAPLRTSVLHGLAELIQRHGGRLRACQRCGAPLLPRKRQTFCVGLPGCGQLARDQRKREARTRRQGAAGTSRA